MKDKFEKEFSDYQKQKDESHKQYIKESEGRIISFEDNKRRTDVLEKDVLSRSRANDALIETNSRIASAWESIAQSLKVIANK